MLAIPSPFPSISRGRDCPSKEAQKKLKAGNLCSRIHLPQLATPGFISPKKHKMQIELTVTLFKGFQTLCKQGDWFSFAKRRAPSLVCVDDNHATIDDPKPVAGSFNMANVRRLSIHVIKLRDMPEGADGNVMGIHDFLCLPEWTGAEVQEEPHLDVRPTLQRLPFYCTPPAAADAVIPNPTPEDLAAGTPSSKILAKAEASQKRKASTSGAASSHVAKRTRSALAQSSGSTTRPSLFAGDDDESDDDDACVEIPLVTPLRSAVVIPSLGNQDSRGNKIMVDDVVAPSGGNLYATYPEDGVAGNSAALNEGLELQVSTLKKQVSRLNDKLATSDASFSKSKAKGNERKKKIKSLSKSLDNFHSEVARLSAALNQTTILEAERDEERLAEASLLVAQTDYAFLNKISEYAIEPLSVILQLEPKKLVRPANVPIPRDTRVSPLITKDSTMIPVSKSLELSANVVPASLAVSLEQNEEQVSAVVDGSDLKITDGAARSKSEGVFVQGTFYVLDDVAEVTVVGSKRVSFGLTDVVVALYAGDKGDGSALSSTVKEVVVPPSKFGFAPSALLVTLPFLLLLVSSTDGLVLKPTDNSWLRNSLFIVARPVNTSAFRNKLRILFGLLGVGLRMIACILLGFALSPSFVTIWPRNLPSFTPNEDMGGTKHEVVVNWCNLHGVATSQFNLLEIWEVGCKSILVNNSESWRL
ncbi:hypothetical protein Tco_0924534 [Tanacetum coccineum]|uniref:Uncharacterized protein n=1 Tax=Tanacetum coccineum TaxID=301880 RepID=A0ABQ5D449_9ASTR